MLDDDALAENDGFLLAADCQQVNAVPTSNKYVDRSLLFIKLLLVFCVYLHRHMGLPTNI